MKKSLIAGIMVALPSALLSQSAVDAYSVSQNELRGSARFMSMGGAFTALGGDISTLNQNPAGIGIYRSSDISATLDINMMSSKSTAAGMSNTENWTRAACNNFGYVGTISLGSESVMPFLNWGASYSRVASFDRHYGGSLGSLGTSYTNFVADFTNILQIYPIDLLPDKNYNPYLPYSAPWSSILMYNSCGITPVSPGANEYSGLYNYNGTTGSGEYMVEEKGYVDEYSINFGGNIQNLVYWGVGFGITDIDYRSNTYYAEYLDNANISDGNENINENTYIEGGNADLQLSNYKRIYGSGFNFKVGVIVKPINELRFGVAVHTPTYYNLTYQGIASTNFSYKSSMPDVDINSSIATDYNEFDWQLKSPWRFMVGAAGVIGGKAIISAEYEYRGTQNMCVKDYDGNEYKDITRDIKNYYKATNIMRIGTEYRVTPSFSVRAGYSYETSPVTQEAMNGDVGQEDSFDAALITSGPHDSETQPSFTLDKTTQYITCGIGYRYKNFYADAAYVHRTRKSKYNAFNNYPESMTGYFVTAPSAEVSDNNNSIILTVGFKF